MAKIDLTTAPAGEGTRDPAEYAAPGRARRWIKLGDPADPPHVQLAS